MFSPIGPCVWSRERCASDKLKKMMWKTQREYHPENIARTINDQFVKVVFRARPGAESADWMAHINSIVRSENDEHGNPFEPNRCPHLEHLDGEPCVSFQYILGDGAGTKSSRRGQR